MKPVEMRRCAAVMLAGAALLLGCLVNCGCRKKDNSPATPVQSIRTAGGIEMVLVPAGDFLMGNDRGEEDEKPAHRVHVEQLLLWTNSR